MLTPGLRKFKINVDDLCGLTPLETVKSNIPHLAQDNPKTLKTLMGKEDTRSAQILTSPVLSQRRKEWIYCMQTVGTALSNYLIQICLFQGA